MASTRFLGPVCSVHATSFLLSVFLVGLATARVYAASDVPLLLSVPPAGSTAHIAVRLPPRFKETTGAGQLVEVGGPGTVLSIDRAATAHGESILAVVPRTTGTSNRAFRLEPRPTTAVDKPKFRITEINEGSLGVWEADRPVFVYNHGVQSRSGVPSDRNRSTYVHPVYGLDGEVLTDDFPKDHYHHRGLFWAWPHVQIEGKNYDLWDIRGIHQRFERWLHRSAGNSAAVLGIANGWYIGHKKVMAEQVWLTVFAASAESRVLDVDLTWIPEEKPVTLVGAEDKSYGGLTLRFAPRTGTVVTTPLGNMPDDLAMTPLAWGDLSGRFAGAPGTSGAAIFINPDHPDYPPTWLTRHYGALCVGWPGVKGATFAPGQEIHCRYRVWVHRGSPDGQRLSQAYEAYRADLKAQWITRSE